MGKPRISRESSDWLFGRRDYLTQQVLPLRRAQQEVAALVAPSMIDWSDTAPAANVKAAATEQLYDNTGLKNSLMLADGIQGYSFSRRDPWFRNTLPDPELLESEEVAEWTQAFERHMYRQYSKNNFYDEARLFTKSCADFATGVMMMRENWAVNRTFFETLHPKNYLLEDDSFGFPEVIFQRIWRQPWDAAQIYGYENLPETVRQAVDSKSTQFFPFTRVIMPTDMYDLDLDIRNSRGKPYVSITFADGDRYEPVFEQGFETKPFIAWRWSRNLDGGAYGCDSPGLIERSNMKQMNGMTMDYALLVERLARPPIKATPGVARKINLKPNGVTALDPGEDFAAAMATGNINGVYENLMQLRQGNAATYHVDFFLILTQAIQQDKTATEVEGLQGEKAALLASFFSRMATEFLEPLHRYTVYTELRYGRFQRPIPEDLKGMEMDMELISPLAMMQRRFLSLEPTKQAMAELLAMANFRPEILDGLDFDKFRQIVVENYNMDRRVTIDMADVTRMRQERAKRQEQERQAQVKNINADTSNKEAGAMKQAAEARGINGGA